MNNERPQPGYETSYGGHGYWVPSWGIRKVVRSIEHKRRRWGRLGVWLGMV